MRINTKFVDGKKERFISLKIRRKVFIEEQGIPEEIEMDKSINATSVLALINSQYVGTARYQRTESGIKLERFAVLKEYRGLGIGKALVHFICKKIDNSETIYLHAQESVVSFYMQFGFKTVKDRFFEAGIPHWQMIKNEK